MIEQELECQICLDLLVEPVTTMCGHTFCKLCLLRYLKDKINCPMCRKLILQSKDTLNKNVVLENLIKSKYKDQYESKLKIVKLSLQTEESGENDSIRNNIPCFIQEGDYIWPKSRKRIVVTNMEYDLTINISSINDRIILVVPNQINVDNCNTTVSSLCEIVNYSKRDNEIILELVGLKRFKVSELRAAGNEDNNGIIQNDSSIFLANGQIVKDLEISSQDILSEIYSKLKKIEEMNNNILIYAPSYIPRQLETLYGKAPSIQSILSVSNLEPITFYYLNLLKSEAKQTYYLSSNIKERVDFIYEQFLNAEKFEGNQSLAFEFYEINVSGKPKDHLKFTIIFFVLIFLFCLAYKYKYIKINY